MSQLVQLSSAFRDAETSSSSSNCTMIYTIPIRPVLPTWQLVQALFPNTIYQIDANNCVIDLLDGAPAVAKVCTIVQGVYTAASLVTAVATALNNAVPASAATWTVTYSAITMKYTITSAVAASSIRFATGANASSGSNIWKILGFSDAIGSSAADTASVLGATVGAMAANFAIPLSFYISIQINGNTINSITLNDTRLPATIVLPMVAGQGELIAYGPRDLEHFRFTVPPTPIFRITVRIFDELNRTIDLHGGDWSMLFQQL